MSVNFTTVGHYEKVYAFENAVIDTAMYNGTFGATADGKFTAGANGTKVIMNIERGDDEHLEKYLIPAGSHVRVLDLVAFVEQYPKIPELQVYGYPLPDAYVKGDKLASDAEGKLATGASAAPYLEVTEIIGNKAGAVVTVVTE